MLSAPLHPPVPATVSWPYYYLHLAGEETKCTLAQDGALFVRIPRREGRKRGTSGAPLCGLQFVSWSSMSSLRIFSSKSENIAQILLICLDSEL